MKGQHIEPTVFITAFAVFALAAIIISYFQAERKLRESIEARFGQPVSPPEFEEDHSGLWLARRKHEKPAHTIDDITWNDLDMDRIFDMLNACQTSVGEEYLYAMLREPVFDRDELLLREALLELLGKAPEQRLELQVYLAKMSKASGNGLSAFCYDISANKIKRPWRFNVLAVLPLLFAAVLFFHVGAGAALVAVATVGNGLVYYRMKRKLDLQMASVRYFCSLLWCAEKICKTHVLDSHAVG